MCFAATRTDLGIVFDVVAVACTLAVGVKAIVDNYDIFVAYTRIWMFQETKDEVQHHMTSAIQSSQRCSSPDDSSPIVFTQDPIVVC